MGPTDVHTYRGISGIVHRRNGMFLVGVFLPDVELPGGNAPPRLDFTKRERFRSLAPRIGQTFLIGDGKRRSYEVPGGRAGSTSASPTATSTPAHPGGTGTTAASCR